jgi:hypothetical protein
MRRLAILALAALALLPLACASKHSPTPPAVQLGPLVQEVSPLARSPRTIYDTEIWARFDRPLVAQTIDSTTVFLKIDTRRIPMDVVYEGITRRIRVIPRAILDLSRTYTVEFSPRIQAQDGTTLGTTYFWQFTTNSLRRVRYDYPAPTSLEGPFSSVAWSGNGPPVTGIQYDVYASTDLNAVLGRSILPVAHTPFLSFSPRHPWPLGATVYWAVDGINLATGEVLQGPVAQYQVLPEGTPVDSFTVATQDYGGIQNSRNAPQLCTSATLSAGSLYNSGIRWLVSGTRDTLRLAGVSAELWLTVNSVGVTESAQPALWSAQNPWLACNFIFPGPPFPNTGGGLAFGHADADPSHVVFRSDTLTSFVEQMARRNAGQGFLLRAVSTINFSSPATRPPAMKVYYYRSPAAPFASPRFARRR